MLVVNYACSDRVDFPFHCNVNIPRPLQTGRNCHRVIIFTIAMLSVFVSPVCSEEEDKALDQRFFATDKRTQDSRRLAEVIKEFNLAQASDPVGAKQPPLNSKEVIRALNYQHLINDLPEKLDPLLAKVVDESEMPAGAVFRFISGGSRARDGVISKFWLVTLSFFLGDPALLKDKTHGAAEKGYRVDVVIRANFNIR